MSGQPYMPFFLGDFLASTLAWSGEERALYMLLLACQWANGPLPEDPARIARMVQFERDTFLALWPTVKSKFVQAEGGGLVNLRCEKHREKAAEVSRKRSEAGAKGGLTTQARLRQTTEPSGGQTDDDGEANALANGEANASSLLSHPIQSNPIQSIPSQPKQETNRAPSTRDAFEDHDGGAKRETPDPVDDEFAQIQAAYPKREGSQRWQDARKAYNARKREGHTFDEILAGVIRYTKHVRAKGAERTAYVQQAATFLGTNKGFLEPWVIGPTRAESRQERSVSAAQAWLDDDIEVTRQ